MPDRPESAPGAEIGAPDRFIRYTTLRQLQVFEAIVRLGSFTRAAEELFLTQPTVSMQIKKLAETVGTPLFDHVGRNVQPTEAGWDVYAACRDVFRVLTDLETRLADLKGLKRGRLRLGVVTTAKYFAPEILGAFCERYPGIDVALKVTNRDRLLERLGAHEDDVYILGAPTAEAVGIVSIPFAPNPLIIIARHDHPLVGERNIPLARIAEEQFILREPGSGIRDAVLRRFAEENLKPRVRMELGSNEAIKHAVVGGLGISALSLHTLTLEGINGPVALLDVQDFPIRKRWYLAYPKGRELSLVAKTFLEFAIESESSIRARMEAMLPGLGDDDEELSP